MTNDRSGLAAARSSAPNPGDYVVLPETISKEASLLRFAKMTVPGLMWLNGHLLPCLRPKNWVLTPRILTRSAKPQLTLSLNVFWAQRAILIKDLGLSPDWAYQVIKQVGNYDEIYERNLGTQHCFGLDRKGTLNELVDARRVALLKVFPLEPRTVWRGFSSSHCYLNKPVLKVLTSKRTRD